MTSKAARNSKRMTLGIISDTHGLLRGEAAEVFKDAGLIVHAGDIGTEAVVTGLETIAPVVAVRGNMDHESWARRLPLSEIIEMEGHRIYVIHDGAKMDLDPGVADIDIVITGHSHRPLVQRHDNVLYVNPGSAGPRRFTLPVTVALLTIQGGEVDARIISLKA